MVLAPVESARPRADRETPHALTAYLPRILGDWLASTPEQTHRSVEGTLVFADISGFTRLTERLARLGRVGAEEMSDALNATFTQLLGEAGADGADLVKWGGDAVLLLFDGPDHAPRAARAAFRMRARLRTVGRLTTSAGQARLRMSVGLHSGDLPLLPRRRPRPAPGAARLRTRRPPPWRARGSGERRRDRA